MPELNDEQWRAIDAEILAERMISAIKSYRALTGAGLKSAKNAVEARAQYLLGTVPGALGESVVNDLVSGLSGGTGWEAVDAEIFAGRKIQAIKLYRGISGLGLKESKEMIEARELELRQTNAAKFEPTRKAGCMSVILVVIGVLVVLKSVA